MNALLTDLGALIAIVYTAVLLGHILYKGLVANTLDNWAAAIAHGDEEEI